MLKSWDKYLEPLINKYEIDIDKIYDSSDIIYPPKEKIWNAFSYFNPEETKVILLGLDPYIREDQAMGLSFSVPDGEDLPPSLKNIYKEIESDIGCKMNFKNGNLIDWAKQNILLLNSALTVIQGKTGSHTKIWSQFTDSLIKNLSNDFPHIIFILLGNVARSKASLIENKNNIIEAVHPSPLSANRGFFGSKIFSKCNKLLVKPINWCNY
jgi:uracil-DNA glycosylase